MLTSGSVSQGLSILGSAYRRKISAELILVYHRVLSRHLHQEQFEDAVNAVLEHENNFPSVATLLMYGRASSRHRRERGEPYVHDMPLREYLEWVGDRGRPAPPDDGRFASEIERLIYEDAAVTERAGYDPSKGEDATLRYIERICAKAEGEQIRLRQFEEGRHGTT